MISDFDITNDTHKQWLVIFCFFMRTMAYRVKAFDQIVWFKNRTST